MKNIRMRAGLLAVFALLPLSACKQTAAEGGAGKNAETTELTVFAAASLTGALEAIKGLYEDANPGVALTLTLDSSGTLKTQIQEGADCDVFISASRKSMDQLDISASPDVNTDGLDFVAAGTRADIASNFCVLAVPEGNPSGITGFKDAATDKVVLMALGNSDVPAGQYAQEIFEHLGIWGDVRDKITFCSNVKEVTTQVAEYAVDCGVVYGTDAIGAGLDWVDRADGSMHTAVVYPAAVMKSSHNEKEARAFTEYLTLPQAQECLKAFGFSPPATEASP